LLLHGGRIGISVQWQTWSGAGFELKARVRTG